MEMDEVYDGASVPKRWLLILMRALLRVCHQITYKLKSINQKLPITNLSLNTIKLFLQPHKTWAKCGKLLGQYNVWLDEAPPHYRHGTTRVLY